MMARRHSSIILAEVKQRNNFVPFQPYACFRRALPVRIANRAMRFASERVVQPAYLAALNRFLAARTRRAGAALMHAPFGMMGYKSLRAKPTPRLPLIPPFYRDTPPPSWHR